MITLYVSHTFIEEFERRADLSDELIQDFRIRFLKKVRGIDVLVNIKYEDTFELTESNEFYSDLNSISPIKCEEDWLGQLDNPSFINSGSFSKVFLLGNDVDCNTLSKNNKLLYINNNNLKDLWELVKIDREISVMTPDNKEESEFSFTSWRKLSNFKHPFKDIVLFDKYILGDNANQKIKDNILPMVTEFSKFNSDNHFQLSIFSEKLLRPRNISNPVEKISELHNRIERNNCKIIYYKMNLAPEMVEHDRRILTNYMFFECGAGWNIFTEHGNVRTITTVRGDSIFKNDIRNAATKALKSFREYYSRIRDKTFTIVVPGAPVNGNLQTIEVCYHSEVGFHPVALELNEG